MIKLDNEAFDKSVRNINAAVPICLEVHAKIANMGYKGTIQPLANWTNSCEIIPVVVFIEGDYPLEYSCGIVAEIETILGVEDAKMSTYADIGRVEYHLKYKGVRVLVFFFPKDTCHWVETGEVETTVKKKLVCA